MIHSFTSIDAFHGVCPKQMYERYITKSVPFFESPEMKKGKEDHKALELRLINDKALPEHLAACEGMIQAFNAKGTPFAELKTAVDKNLAPTGFFDLDAYIRGVLDVVLMTDHWKFGFVADWKTGKNREAGKEPLQLMLSAAYVFAGHEVCEQVTAVNIYTTTGKMGTPHTWKRSELPEIWRTIMPLVHEIEEAEKIGASAFKEKPSGLCGYCPVKKCQHNRAP